MVENTPKEAGSQFSQILGNPYGMTEINQIWSLYVIPCGVPRKLVTMVQCSHFMALHVAESIALTAEPQLLDS